MVNIRQMKWKVLKSELCATTAFSTGYISHIQYQISSEPDFAGEHGFLSAVKFRLSLINYRSCEFHFVVVRLED